MMFGALTLGGLIQGFAQQDPGVAFMTSVSLAAPWRILRAFSGMLLLGAHVIFAVLFTLMLLKLGNRREGPTLLGKPSEKVAVTV
jgi:cytochrome c oxidase cbb3-type subunit 1